MSTATPEQIITLLNFLVEHRDLARGQLRSLEGKIRARRLWEEIKNELNSMGGCTKTVQQWQKVWADKKYNAKKSSGECRRSASATGDGPSTSPNLTESELKVLSIMGEDFGQSQTSARVPAFNEPNEPLPSSSQTSHPPDFSQQSNMDVVESNQPTQPMEFDSQAISATDSTQESAAPRRPTLRARRRQPAAGADVRSRLFEFEESRAEREQIRNAELAGIKAALVEMCGLIREYLDR